MKPQEEPESAGSDMEDDSKHAELLENVLSLTQPLRIKKPSRTEPTVHVSEYDLVRSITGPRGAVRLHDLTGVLKHKSRHVELGKKLKRAERKAKTLPKPLERPQAEKIRRAVGYERTRQELDKWEPVITANRASLNLKFPLNTDVNFGQVDKLKYEFRVKSELQKKLEEVESKYEVHVVEPEEERKEPLTLREILERRRLAAKMRAHQSYKEAKARRQNKIKSKKFHRIQRREKLKQQMKEFELLQKNDPEAALKKLEEIERIRAEERFSLRHKNTGKWARNNQIRAKYNKESRQVLAQQLAISRDLTQKVKVDEESDSEDERGERVTKPSDPNNPWVSEVDEEVGNFIKSYKKYWEAQNKGKELEMAQNKEKEPVEAIEEVQTKKEEEKEESPKQVVEKKNKKAPKRKVESSSKRKDSTEWKVTSVEDETALENIFDDLEQQIEKKVKKKAKTLLKTPTKTGRKIKTQKTKSGKKQKKVDMTIPKAITRPVIDEELLENTVNEAEDTMTQASRELEVLQNILDATEKPEPKQKVAPENSDQEIIADAEPVVLNTAVPELLTVEESENEDDGAAGISEAFEDEEIVAEFNKEKAAEIEKSKPKKIDLTLPGWGSWGGKDLKVPKKKRRKFIIKFPKPPKRKDMNKGKVIINEDGNEKARAHLVSEIPFPFKTVKDFEASIRAPIGSTFVPELPHRRMIRPPVRTKMGAIIEPMSEEILLKKALKGMPVVK